MKRNSPRTQVLLGDCLETLKKLPDNSVDSVITDPPYGLSAAKNSGKKSKGGFMGKLWDYDVPSVEIWREVYRVLKPGGHLLAFGGTRTYHRLAVNIEDAGFEVRDQIMWIYGSGFPKSMAVDKAIDKAAGAKREVVGINPNNRDRSKHKYNSVGNVGSDAVLTAPATDAAKKWAGWGTALKPANEPICLARKPIEAKLTVAQNVLKYGVGGLNIDQSRIDAKPRKTGTKAHGDSATGSGSSIVGSSLSRQQKYDLKDQGRFPANVIFDEYTASLLDEQSGSLSKQGSRKLKDCPSPTFAGGSKDSTFYGDSGGASRFFYCAKASSKERNAGLEGMPFIEKSNGNKWTDQDYRVKKGERPPNAQSGPRQNHHPTVKPIKLMEYLIKLVTPEGGTVLDPFTGSGSTGVAAVKLGFDFIGCELSKEYREIAKRRIKAAV